MPKWQLPASARYIEDPGIRLMRIRTWFRSVAHVSGKTAAGLEREFSEGRSGKDSSPRSCIWQKYSRGLVEPQCSLGIGRKPGLVERVEQRYPGTAQWLTMPLWRLADKAPMEMSEIKAVYCMLPKLLKSMFIASPEQATGVFWRRHFDIEDACELLLRYAKIEGFVALLALIREAEIVQGQWQHQCCVKAAKRFIRPLMADPVVGKSLNGELDIYLVSRWQEVGYFGSEDAPE